MRLRTRRRARRRKCMAALLVLLVSYVLVGRYVKSRGILRDGNITRFFPRVQRELCRDLCVNWGRSIVQLRAESTFSAGEDLRLTIPVLQRAGERARTLRRQLVDEGLSFDFINAVDGRSMTVSEAVLVYAGPRRRKLILNRFSKGVTQQSRQDLRDRARFACFLTHVRIWKSLVSSSSAYTIVLEDDVVIAKAFAEKLFSALSSLPRTWDILYLNATEPHYGARLRLGLYQSRGALGTFGYAVSLSGATKLLEIAKRSDKPIDHMLDSAIYTGKINAFHIVPPLVSHNDALESTITSMRVVK